MLGRDPAVQVTCQPALDCSQKSDKRILMRFTGNIDNSPEKS